MSTQWTRQYTAKLEFARLMKKFGVERAIPPTYESVDEVPPIASGELWFVKESVSSRGRGVTAVRSLSEMKQVVATLPPASYVLQKGVENLDLYQDKKYTLRVYILQLPDGRVYVHRRVLGIQHKAAFDHNNANHDIHVSHTGATRYDFNATHPKSSLVLERIFQATKEIFAPLRSQIDFKGAGYHFYGADFLVDRSHNVWLLEINSFPDVYSHAPDVRAEIITEFFTDLYRLVIAPATRQTVPVVGKFVPVLPVLPRIKKRTM